MFDILIFSIGSLSQNKRLPLYKLNADGDNIDSTKKPTTKTPKKTAQSRSVNYHSSGNIFFFLWLRGLLLKSRKYFKQTTTCIDY